MAWSIPLLSLSQLSFLSPPSFLPTPGLLTVGQSREKEKREGLGTVQALLSDNQNTGVLSMLF